MPSPFAAFPVQSSESRLVPSSHASQLSLLRHAYSFLQRSFSSGAGNNEKHLPGLMHLTFSWSHTLRVKDFSFCCSSVRVHVQPQMDGALIFLQSSTWDLINGDGYYPFVYIPGKKESSLTKIPIILGVCLLIVWMLTIHIPLTLFTITSFFLHTSSFHGVLLSPQRFMPLNDKTKDLHCCYCSFKYFSILYCLTPGHG